MSYSVGNATTDVTNKKSSVNDTTDPDWPAIKAQCGGGSIDEAIVRACTKGLDWALDKMSRIDIL